MPLSGIDGGVLGSLSVFRRCGGRSPDVGEGGFVFWEIMRSKALSFDEEGFFAIDYTIIYIIL
jgi:hypothetical protein